MAIDFNATTSKLENTTAALGITTLVTFCLSVFTDAPGEGTTSRIIQLPQSTNGLIIRYDVANVIAFVAQWSGSLASWGIAMSEGQWHTLGLSYDGGNIANVPIARVDFTNVTPATQFAPVGTLSAHAAGYCIGNRAAGDRTHDGGIGFMCVHDVVLTAAEMDEQCMNPGAIKRGLKLFVPMTSAADINDLSGNGFHGTATDLTDRVGPPDIPRLYPGYRRVQHV